MNMNRKNVGSKFIILYIILLYLGVRSDQPQKDNLKLSDLLQNPDKYTLVRASKFMTMFNDVLDPPMTGYFILAQNDYTGD